MDCERKFKKNPFKITLDRPTKDKWGDDEARGFFGSPRI